MKADKKTGDSRRKLDGSGFFIIHVDVSQDRIVVEHYTYDRKLQNKFAGESAKRLCNRIIDENLINKPEHAMYLGQELAKAEIALKNNLKYKQDKDVVF